MSTTYLDRDALEVSAEMKASCLDGGATAKQAERAADAAFASHRRKQAEAHDAGTWCPEGDAGCFYCKEAT